MARKLVQSSVEIILAAGSEGIAAARDASRTIPIVMTNSGDAVREGFAVSLSRPGGNITGLTQISPELAGKRLEMLREIFPDMRRVRDMWNPKHPNTPITFREAISAADTLRLAAFSFETKVPADVDTELSKATEEGIRAFLVVRDPFTVRHRAAIVKGLHSRNMLAIFETPEFVDAGGLMFYGADFAQMFRTLRYMSTRF